MHARTRTSCTRPYPFWLERDSLPVPTIFRSHARTHTYVVHAAVSVLARARFASSPHHLPISCTHAHVRRARGRIRFGSSAIRFQSPPSCDLMHARTRTSCTRPYPFWLERDSLPVPTILRS